MSGLSTTPETWFTPDSLDPSTNRVHQQIRTVLSSADFDHLKEVALRSRKAQDVTTPVDVTCKVNSQAFTYGMNNLVLKVAFSDQRTWIARVHHAPVDLSGAEQHAMDMLSEIVTMRTITRRTAIPIPKVFAFDVSLSNAFGFPYMLMECLPGRVLDTTIAGHVPVEYHAHVAHQLANVLHELENMAFDQIGRLWCGKSCDEPLRIIPYELGDRIPDTPQTSLEWFYKLRQEQNQAALQDHFDDPEWKTACWILKTATSHIIREDRLHGPFPLCHFDLYYGNLLFDDQYNLTGIIDWSQAGTAPVERLAVSPEFITFPAISDEENQVIINFRDNVRACLQDLVDQARLSSPTFAQKTTLSMILGSKQAEITHRCTYSRSYRAIFDGRLVSKLIYGDTVTWEQLVAVYGHLAY